MKSLLAGVSWRTCWLEWKEMLSAFWKADHLGRWAPSGAFCRGDSVVSERISRGRRRLIAMITERPNIFIRMA